MSDAGLEKVTRNMFNNQMEGMARWLAFIQSKSFAPVRRSSNRPWHIRKWCMFEVISQVSLLYLAPWWRPDAHDIVCADFFYIWRRWEICQFRWIAHLASCFWLPGLPVEYGTILYDWLASTIHRDGSHRYAHDAEQIGGGPKCVVVTELSVEAHSTSAFRNSAEKSL